MKNRRLKAGIVFLALLAAGPLAMADQTITLKVTSALPTPVAMTQQFLKFVKQVNSSDALNIKIDYLGGPEVVPPTRQGGALQNGVIDMAFGPSNYYLDTVPEGAALMASTVNAPEARANGGMKLLDSIYNKKMGAHLLGWFGSGENFFHIYTVNEPTFGDNGQLQGDMRIRSKALYRGVLEGMGFQPMSIEVPNVYTALQRGVVDGVGWPLIGIQDLGWTDYLRYRINPGFYNNTTVVLVSLDEWNNIPKDQRQKLQALANAFEKQSMKAFAEQSRKIAKELAEQGMEVVTLEGAALQRFNKLVSHEPWELMKKYGASQVSELKAHFAPDSK